MGLTLGTSRKISGENIAMVLQDTQLFSGPVREEIRYGCLATTGEEVIAAAKVACARLSWTWGMVRGCLFPLS